MNYEDLARPVAMPVGTPLYHRVMGDPQWLAQEKVDGVRCCVEMNGSQVHFTSRHGKSLAGKVAQEAKELLHHGYYILDAELLDGRLYLFDMLALDGESLLDKPLGYRWMQLARGVVPAMEPWVQLAETSTQKLSFYDEMIEKGAEGIVCKHIRDPYPPREGAQWLKVKPGK